MCSSVQLALYGSINVERASGMSFRIYLCCLQVMLWIAMDPPEDMSAAKIIEAKVEREGTDVTIITFSKMTGLALEAAEAMAAKGVSVEVINLLSIRPLDRDAIINSAKKTGRVITLETGWPQCGVGSEISAILMESDAFNYLDAPMERITGADVPMPYAKELEDAALPQLEDVCNTIDRIMYRHIAA